MVDGGVAGKEGLLMGCCWGGRIFDGVLLGRKGGCWCVAGKDG